MRMQVKCGNLDCREEFYVDSMDPLWECPDCSREIENRNYPFLTAVLMQAKIDGDQTSWKAMYKKLITSARKHIEARGGKDEDMEYLKEAERSLEDDKENQVWKERHDELLRTSREVILGLEKDG